MEKSNTKRVVELSESDGRAVYRKLACLVKTLSTSNIDIEYCRTLAKDALKTVSESSKFIRKENLSDHFLKGR